MEISIILKRFLKKKSSFSLEVDRYLILIHADSRYNYNSQLRQYLHAQNFCC